MQLLQQQVDYSDLGLFSNPFEAFSSSPNHYIGIVEAGSFRIRRRHRLFDKTMLPVVATGTTSSAGARTQITAEANGAIWWLLLFFGFFGLLFFTGVVVSIVTQGAPLALLLFPLVQICFMLGLPYYLMRNSVSRTVYDLERVFFFLASKQPQADSAGSAPRWRTGCRNAGILLTMTTFA